MMLSYKTYLFLHLINSANFYAGMDPEGMHLGDPKIAPTFIKNFFTDFKAILGKKHQIKDFKKCDFSPIKRHLDEQKVVNKAITDSERQRNKEIKNATMFKFGYALVDGHLEKVGNYNSECLIYYFGYILCVLYQSPSSL